MIIKEKLKSCKKILIVCSLLAFFSCSTKVPLPKLGSAVNFSQFANTIEDNKKLKKYNIQTLTKTLVKYKSKKISLKHAFFVKEDKLRIETLPSTGMYTLNYIIVNDNKVIFYDPETNKRHTKDFSKETIEDLIGVPLSVEELVSYLQATLPNYVNSDYGLFVNENIQLASSDNSRYYELSKITNKLVKLEHRVGNDLEFSINYLDDKNFEIYHPSKKINVKIKILNTNFDKNVKDKLFN